MLVNIVHFPKIKDGKDKDFLQWFADSNRAYADHPGFIRRILLRPREDGNYVAIVEHESHETFMVMHTSSTQAALRKEVQPLFVMAPPTPNSMMSWLNDGAIGRSPSCRSHFISTR